MTAKTTLIYTALLGLMLIASAFRAETLQDVGAPGQATQRDEMQEYRTVIRQVIQDQGKRVIAEDVLQLLETELEKPFAVGGRSKGELTQHDLEAGWELFISKGTFRAEFDFKSGDAASVSAQWVTIIVTVSGRNPEGRQFLAVVRPVGSRTSIEDFILNHQELQKAGIIGEPQGKP